MPTIPDRDLLFYAEDLLDPDEASDISARLAADPDLRDRLATLVLPLPSLPPAAPAPSRWLLPPPGRGWGAEVQAAAVMGDTGPAHQVRQGRRFQVLLDAVHAPETQEVVILRRLADRGWEVLFPRTAAERATLTRLRQRDDGRWQVDLVAAGPPGPQRWAIALAPQDLAQGLDWDAPPATRWLPLQHALGRGALPSATVHIEVLAA